MIRNKPCFFFLKEKGFSQKCIGVSCKMIFVELCLLRNNVFGTLLLFTKRNVAGGVGRGGYEEVNLGQHL